MTIHLEWKLADCWVGAFWQRRETRMHLWVCLLPCLPIHITWERPTPGAEGA